MAEKESKNPIIYILVGLLVVAAFAVGSLYTKVKMLEKGATAIPAANNQQAQAPNQPPPAKPTVEISQVREAFKKSILKFGDANKKLVLLEIADPSCPFCSVAAGKNGELNKQIGDRFKLVADGGTYVAPVPEMKKLLDSGKASYAYIYSPGHGNGEMGTKAFYCAYEKNKFWEVHNKIMTNDGYNLLNNTVKNDKTKSQEIADFLKSVVDPTDLKKCLDSGKYDAQLQADTTLATSLGIQGTPGFLVNTTLYAGAYSYKDMETTVNDLLK